MACGPRQALALIVRLQQQPVETKSRMVLTMDDVAPVEAVSEAGGQSVACGVIGELHRTVVKVVRAWLVFCST